MSLPTSLHSNLALITKIFYNIYPLRQPSHLDFESTFTVANYHETAES